MYKKFKNYKDKKILLISFFLPIIILLFFCINNGITYNDFFVADLQEQYSLFFYYLKDVFDGNSSIFYSYYKQLGGSMLGTYIYYLSSPWNLLLFLIPKSKISIFIVLLIFTKIGLSSTTMYLYFKKHFKKDDNMFLLFSLTYALSGFAVFYFFNIIWLDLVYLAPLVLIGLDKIINNEKSTFYIITLWISIISNGYMAYILCVFLVIYFLYEILIQNNKNKKELLLKFIKSSILTVLLSLFILIPFVYELVHVYRNGSYSSFSLSLIFKRFIRIFYSFFISLQDKKVEWWLPNLYLSIINLILLILYFLNKKINLREKKITLIFIIFFILCYSIPILNNIWHGTSPQLLNYRYSYLVTIFLILISYKSYSNIKYIEKKDLMQVFTIAISLYLISYIIVKNTFNFVIVINLFFIGAYFLILKVNIKYQNYLYKLSLIFITILEIIIYLKFNFVTNKSLEKEFVNYDNDNELCEILANYDSVRIDGRVYSYNESLICNNGKIADFNTMNNKRTYNFLKNNGYTIGASYVENYYDEINIINDILGIKYFYTSENVDNLYLKLQDVNTKKGNYGLYQNNNYLSIGFAIEENKVIENTNNNFEYTNSFVNYLSGEYVYYKYDFIKTDNNTFLIDINNDYPIYINYNNIYYDYIYINDEKIKLNSDYEYETSPRDDTSRTGNIYIKNKYYGMQIELKIDSDEDINEDELLIYYLDMDKYENIIKRLSSEQLENIIINKTILEGTIDLSESKTLFLSIPYDDNFTVYVDGKKMEYKELFGTFMGIDLEKGKHSIKLVYFPKYIWIGLRISIMTLIMLLFNIKHKFYVKNYN